MGTNYYLRTDVCTHCQRAKEHIHVGKSSVGWPFLFRGYRKWPPDGVPHPITSAREWDAFIKQAIASGGQLFDEYGKRQDVTEFWQLVTGKRGETRGPDACPDKHGSRESEWFDADGYRFVDSEFS